jgi:hypothetical protein
MLSVSNKNSQFICNKPLCIHLPKFKTQTWPDITTSKKIIKQVSQAIAKFIKIVDKSNLLPKIFPKIPNKQFNKGKNIITRYIFN